MLGLCEMTDYNQNPHKATGRASVFSTFDCRGDGIYWKTEHLMYDNFYICDGEPTSFKPRLLLIPGGLL